MSQNLTFLAGERAFSLIREYGLRPDMVKVMAGASGGPKWLVLSGLDRVICPTFFNNRKEPLFLIGTSIGAWRFAALSRNDQIEAIDRFQSSYISQVYNTKPTPENVTRESLRILNDIMPDDTIREILHHPYMRLNLLAVRCKWPIDRDDKIPQSLGLLMAGIFNVVNRNLLGLFFGRSLFYDSRDIPPFYGMSGFSIERIPLTEKNIKSALLASGAIPLAMSGVKAIWIYRL